MGIGRAVEGVLRLRLGGAEGGVEVDRLQSGLLELCEERSEGADGSGTGHQFFRVDGGLGGDGLDEEMNPFFSELLLERGHGIDGRDRGLPELVLPEMRQFRSEEKPRILCALESEIVRFPCEGGALGRKAVCRCGLGQGAGEQ